MPDSEAIGAVSYNSYSSLTTDSTIGVVGVFDDRTTDDRQEPQATCALPCLSHNASKAKIELLELLLSVGII